MRKAALAFLGSPHDTGGSSPSLPTTPPSAHCSLPFGAPTKSKAASWAALQSVPIMIVMFVVVVVVVVFTPIPPTRAGDCG